MKYSVVIPVYNEDRSVAPLLQELLPVLGSLDGDFEVLFINDGSTDNTAQELSKLATDCSQVQCFHIRKRSGKSFAYSVGFSKASGGVFITLDGDLQDDPGEIPSLLAKLDEGFDLVVGMKSNRIETELYKKIPSYVFNLILFLCFGLRLKDSNSGFRVIKREVINALRLYGDRYRFIPQLAHVNGFKVGEQPVIHRRREYGSSKYGILRFYTGLCDLIAVRFVLSFNQKPLQFFGAIALIPFVIGVGLEARVIIYKLLGDDFRTHMAALVSGIFLLLVSVQIVSLGLIGELISSNRKSELSQIPFQAEDEHWLLKVDR